MNNLFYQELGKISSNKKALTDADYECLKKTAETIIDMSAIARRDGIFALEKTACEISDRDLSNMLVLICDGVDPELFEELQMIQYFSKYRTDIERMAFIMKVCGILSIQSGEKPRILEEKLYMFLPYKMQKGHEVPIM